VKVDSSEPYEEISMAERMASWLDAMDVAMADQRVVLKADLSDVLLADPWDVALVDAKAASSADV
jgi:hypothetical protein